MKSEHNMNSVVKPPRMAYAKWGLLICIFSVTGMITAQLGPEPPMTKKERRGGSAACDKVNQHTEAQTKSHTVSEKERKESNQRKDT